MSDHKIQEKDVSFLYCSTDINITKNISSILKNTTPPTAIFATSFYYSVNVLKALNSLKMSIPNEISMLGFDDISEFNTYPVTITSLHQPKEEISNKAVELILKKMSNQQENLSSSFLYNVKIVQGESIKDK